MVMGEETFETEVAVIGGGPGGYAAAFRAADLGLDVTLINAEEQLGGVCLRRGCIPSKALLQAAHVMHEARAAADWGITFDRPQIDLDALRSWKDGVVDRLVKGLDQLSRQRDLNVIQAHATFEGPHKVRLSGADLAHVQFEQAIIAAGSQPIPLPDTPFSEGSRIMDAAAALALPDIPSSLLIVGGGYIGLELGMVYATLGSDVTLVEMTDGLLPGTDRDLVKPLARRAEELFTAVHLQTTVTDVAEAEDGVTVSFENGDGAQEDKYDRVIVAIGRRPRTEELGLAETAVSLTDDGFIRVDDRRRTDAEHIFAVGDVTGEPMLAHKAMHEGKVAAEVIAGEAAAFDVRCIPAVVYTDPQLAWCGLMEAEAEAQQRPIQIGRFPWQASGRARTAGAPQGLTKVIFDADTERVLGVGIVGPGAEDLIAEGALAVEMGAVAQDLALTIHPHPTLTETVAEAADAFLGLATHIFSQES